jgi:hypothetical protein
MAIETAVGDVLILSTDRASHLYAVGRVTVDGQQAFVESSHPIYVSDRVTAAAMAKVMVAPGRRIFSREFGDSEWAELLR